jgi:hypothetical protein
LHQGPSSLLIKLIYWLGKRLVRKVGVRFD